MSQYIKYFKNEMKYLKKYYVDKETRELFTAYEKPILELLEVATEQGVSGSAADYIYPKLTELIKNAFSFKPFVPINEGEEEFYYISEDEHTVAQSARVSALFRDGERGKAYYLDAIVWYMIETDENGNEYAEGFSGHVQGIAAHKCIKYPFVPRTFYIEVMEKNGEYIITERGKEELRKAYDYYLPTDKKDEKAMKSVLGIEDKAGAKKVKSRKKGKKDIELQKKVKEFMDKPYKIVLIREDDGTYFAEIPELPGCLSSGNTLVEATVNIRRAQKSWLEMAIKDGSKIPLPEEERN